MGLSPVPPPIAAAAPRILIVEDEGIIASHIAMRLAKTGYEVAGIAESSEEAIDKISELNPELVLMDIRIKGEMDGIETAARIRDRFDIPVIYLTAHSDQETINRAKLTGASGFLTKPIHHTSLSTAIEMAIHKHRADRASRHQRAWMATLLGTMADAMLVVDHEGKVQYLNGPAEELTGWSDKSAREQPVALVLPLADAASGLEADDLLMPAVEAHSPFPIPRGLIACNRLGRWFPVEGEIAPSVDAGRVAGSVITFRDASARQEAESELRQEYKMQAVGRLAAGIAHDFNNLLFVILGYTEEILRKSALSDSDRKALTTIRRAGDSAVSITKQLLSFSRKEPGTKQDVSLNDVIRETEDLFRRLGGINVNWHVKLDPSLGIIHADPGHLKQILMNLVSNACEAMPQSGAIFIETANVDIPRPESALTAREAYVSLSVADTGTGMSRETAEHLFEPFFTTREPGRGTGLGLSIVHSIVTDLGGTIHVESEPGKGACFTVYVPRAGFERTTPAGADPVGRESEDAVTILLVEDQESVRSLLRVYLTGAGYRVLEAENGEHAIRFAHEHAGQIDLLITDIAMPKAGGFEVARALAERRKGVRSMFISGYAQELLDGTGELPSGSRFLPKPFARTEFLKSVSELLAQSKKHSTRMSA
jgi:PAS domain S-box-containing protein